ncbi:MAG: fumarate hydratase C-terminal domain-containing protein [Chloroflexi bacterium]|nr:fumarate hydratase C-terminal domain-containing protein [Chloroflexota bacterium]
MSIFGKEYEFTTPLSEDDVRKVKAGDLLYISGDIWSARSYVLKKFVVDREPLPVDTKKMNVFLTGGEGLRPVDKEHTCWDPVPIGVTLGLRFERFFPKLIEYAGLRCVITKGNMGPGTRDACVKFGCLQLTAFGWPVLPRFNEVLKAKVKDEEVYWREAGMVEALIVYHVGKTGPWLVNMDTRGSVLFNQIYSPVNDRIAEVYKKIGLPEDFEYSSLEQ